MADDAFNLESLHRHLEETESYLKKQSDANVLRRSTNSLRGSTDLGASRSVTASQTLQFTKDIAESYSLDQSLPSASVSYVTEGLGSSTPKESAEEQKLSEDSRYSDSVRREELIDRLLSEYNERKRATTRSYLDLPEEPSAAFITMTNHDKFNNTVLFSAEQPEFPVLDHTEPIPEGSQTLFFASDLGESRGSAASRYLASDDMPPLPDDLLDTVKFTQSIQPWNQYSVEEKSVVDEDSIENNPSPPPSLPLPAAPQAPPAPAVPSSRFTIKVTDRSVSPRPRSAPAMISQDKFENVLRSQEHRRGRSRERLAQEAEERFKKQHPFRPALSSSQTRGQNKERIDELYKEHDKKMRQRERMRKEMEEVERLQHTFQPTIKNNSLRMAHNKEAIESLQFKPVSNNKSRYDKEDEGEIADVGERLHSYAAEQKKYQHDLSQAFIEQSLSDYTFQPTLFAQNKKFKMKLQGQKPLYERLADLKRQKHKYLVELREKFDAEQKANMPFQPKIDSKSKEMAEKSYFYKGEIVQKEFSTGVDEAIELLYKGQKVGDRLLQDAQRMKHKKQELMWEREKELAEAMEPPKLSLGTKKIAQKSLYVKADFDTRQQIYQQKVSASESQRRREIDSEFANYFTPHSSKLTQKILAGKRPELLEESMEERVQRLTDDVHIKEQHRVALEKEIYSQLTFTPKLDRISKLCGRKSSVEDLYSNMRAKLHKEQIKKDIESKESEVYTFKPQINKYSKKLITERDSYDIIYNQYYTHRGYEEDRSPSPTPRQQRINLKEPEKMAADIRYHMLKKEEQRRNELILKELAELQGCTFQPSLTANYEAIKTQFEAPVVIPGLARHIELTELAKKHREEAMQREKEAFSVVNVEKFRRPEDGSTIVEGFQFRLDSPRRKHNKSRSEERTSASINISSQSQRRKGYLQ